MSAESARMSLVVSLTISAGEISTFIVHRDEQDPRRSVDLWVRHYL